MAVNDYIKNGEYDKEAHDKQLNKEKFDSTMTIIKCKADEAHKNIVEHKQTFRRYMPKYQLNRETKELVIVGKIDIFEKVQSNMDCALNRILNKFLDLGVDASQEFPKIVFDMEAVPVDNDIDSLDKLEVYTKSINQIQALRDKYHVSVNISDADFIKALQAKANQIKEESKKNEEKIQIEKKSEQKELQKDSAKSASNERESNF